MCYMKTKTTTIRQIRHDFNTVLSWVSAGDEVTVLKRSQPVARICPLRRQPRRKITMPDYAARVKKVFGDRLVPNTVLQEREQAKW